MLGFEVLLLKGLEQMLPLWMQLPMPPLAVSGLPGGGGVVGGTVDDGIERRLAPVRVQRVRSVRGHRDGVVRIRDASRVGLVAQAGIHDVRLAVDDCSAAGEDGLVVVPLGK